MSKNTFKSDATKAEWTPADGWKLTYPSKG